MLTLVETVLLALVKSDFQPYRFEMLKNKKVHDPTTLDSSDNP